MEASKKKTYCLELILKKFGIIIENLFKKRYWVNENFFGGSGPVFLMIGGESEAQSKTMTKGQWIKLSLIHI